LIRLPNYVFSTVADNQLFTFCLYFIVDITSLHRLSSISMLFCASLLLLLLLARASPVYYSYIALSSFGMEFQPRMATQILSMATSRSIARCSAACNQLEPCRTFDYDSSSKQCRLFEGDSTTGSTVPSASPTSIGGTVPVFPSLFTSTHNQPCPMCDQTRYGFCSMNTSTCRCPKHTYWNGLICALQLFDNDTCAQIDACRSNFNLTCSANMYGEFQKCAQSFPQGM
jgi:hypothetical protein